MNLYAFAEGLTNNAIEDFTERCDDQIRYWISGGGYCSTGDAPRNVCANDKSNNPQVPARALYDSIAGFTRKGFEALGLVSNFILERFNKE